MKSPKHAQLIRESAQGLLDDVLAGRSVAERVADLKVYARLLANPDGIVKLLDEGGTEALSYAKRMAGKYPSVNFRVTETIGHVGTETDIGYLNRLVELKKIYGLSETASNAELAAKLQGNLGGMQKVIYKQVEDWGGAYDRFGFYDPTTKVLLAFDNAGELRTAFRPDNGWEYVMSRKWALEIN